MSLPVPIAPLEGVCSTIFNNTLYTYSADAFQSLEMVQDAQWVELPRGMAVQDGVCVKTTPKNDTSAAALFIVGGTTNSSDYRGLQRFTFATGKWDSIQPSVPVTQNRLWHGAAYLNTSDTILVYAGSQDGKKNPSSQTFTIKASEPYDVLAFESIAPPAISPIVMQWTESKAIYIGGSTTNTKAMIFSPSTSWVDSNATLAEPLYNTAAIKAVVINGDDSSKTLYTFDMTVTPNGVNRTILVDANRQPVAKAEPVIEDRVAVLGKRDNLTVADWPVYNNSLAPSSTRTSYAIAKDQSGLVVIAGGNEEDVLCMFKARDNCWANATAQLVSKASAQQGLGTASMPPTATDDATPSSSSSSSSDSSNTAKTTSSPAFPVKILVAVLATIVGVALILLAILLVFRFRRKRRQYNEAGHQRRSSGVPPEKNAVEFTGLPQMSSARQLHNYNHEPQESQGSFSSMAILMGRTGHKRGDKTNGSVGSNTSSQFNKKYKTAISNPIPQDQPFDRYGDQTRLTVEKPAGSKAGPVGEAKSRGNSRGGRRGSTRRSSGWNRYWSGGSALNILGFGSKRNTYTSEAAESDSSRYSDHRPSHITQNSATVAPLRLGKPELNRVMSGSPTLANSSAKPLTREMAGRIERSDSVSTFSSFNDDDRRDAFSSGIPASVHENAWAPVERQDWADGRASSNAYAESFNAQTLPRSTVANFPRDTQFPAPPTQRSPQQKSSDMSWLNLGGEPRM